MQFRFTYEITTNLPIRDLDDGKHLYQATQHSSWNQLCHPMLLSGCMRGQSEMEGFVCNMWTASEYQSYMKKSEAQWNKRAKLIEIRKRNRKSEYHLATHQKWIDEKYMGISHFGAIPMDYNISNIHLDIFHGRRNVHKVILAYIHKLFKGNWTSIIAFAQMLNSWDVCDNYTVVTWILAKPISCLRGAHTLEFYDRIDEVCKLLQSLQNNSKVTALCSALKSFRIMSKLLSFIIIDDFDVAK